MLRLVEVPKWYMCNPYVIKGYRAPMTLYRSFLSILQWHNETLNIHTHLWPGVVLLYNLLHIPYSLPFQEGSLQLRFTMIFGVSSALYCLMASAFFHTVQNVSESWLIFSHNLDIAGIVAVCLGHQITNTLIWSNGHPVFWAIVGIEVLFAARCVQDILKGRSWAIKYPAITTVTTILVTVFVDHHRAAIYCSAACSTFVLIAGTFFKGRFPERCLNNLDCWNSHVWHHVCIVIAITFCMRATLYVEGL